MPVNEFVSYASSIHLVEYRRDCRRMSAAQPVTTRDCEVIGLARRIEGGRGHHEQHLRSVRPSDSGRLARVPSSVNVSAGAPRFVAYNDVVPTHLQTVHHFIRH